MKIPPDPDQQLTPEQVKFLRQSWQAMNRLLVEVLHETRNPIMANIGYSDLLLAEKVGPLNEQQRKMLNNINKSSSFILAVWDDLFVTHPVLFGYLNLNIEEVNLYQLIEQAITDLSQHWLMSYGSDKPTIRPDLPAELPTIWADRLRIQQAITRILLKTVEGIFSHEKSQIVVTASLDDTWVTIKVMAIGEQIAGFLDDNNPRLLFSRIVSEMHGGRMEIEKQEEIELVISLTLPLRIVD